MGLNEGSRRSRRVFISLLDLYFRLSMELADEGNVNKKRLVIWMAASMIVACGQKGALYLPSEHNESGTESLPDAVPARKDETKAPNSSSASEPAPERP